MAKSNCCQTAGNGSKYSAMRIYLRRSRTWQTFLGYFVCQTLLSVTKVATADNTRLSVIAHQGMQVMVEATPAFICRCKVVQNKIVFCTLQKTS
jgi:hypothetical protein